MEQIIRYQAPKSKPRPSGGAGKRLARAQTALDRLQNGKTQGFFDLPFDRASLKEISVLAGKVRRQFDNLLVIGIGGSNLGAKTVYRALGGQADGCRLYFLDTPDPDALALWRQASKPIWKKTAIVAISKSGSTLETMAILLTLQTEINDALGTTAAAKHIFVITETQDNPLFNLALRHGYTIIRHPANVGGRFSVLSAVGLFPAACAGIDIEGLARGAREMENERRKLGAKCSAANFAWQHYLLGRQRPIHVLMTYAKRLNEFGQWYRQLWAESLGKDGLGPTPVAATGPTDQHSQMQLYQEGPKDKIITFLSPKNFENGGQIPVNRETKAAGLAGKALEDIMRAEMLGTMAALNQAGRPADWLEVRRVDAMSLGALFQFYMTAAAYYAALMGVNAFDQPGVEAGKKLARQLLKKL
jgi:glucose-6-phosphate isomerase